MPNNLNHNEPVNRIPDPAVDQIPEPPVRQAPEEPFNEESPADLFDRDDQFYTIDTRTDEEADLQDQQTREQRRLLSVVPGFFTDDETRARMERMESKIPGLLKRTAPNRLMNDLRTYYLGKGECTYTTTEDVLDEEGHPVWKENGERQTREVTHTVPVTNFDQAMDLNNLPMEARKQIVDTFLTDLENHPFGPDVDDATAEENARYYAGIHRQALDRIRKSEWPAYDAKDPGELEKLEKGGSQLFLRATYSQDFSQNTTLFSATGLLPRYRENDRIRRAYLDAFGGVEEYARQKDLQDLAQGLKILAKVARNPRMFSLKQSALAKSYLDNYNTYMGSINTFGPAAYMDGRGLEVMAVGGFFSGVGIPLPEEGAPTDEQLKDYLDGKIDNPFSPEYMDQVDRIRCEERAAQTVKDRDNISGEIAKGDLPTDLIYDLSYVQMPHKTPDAQGQMVDAPQRMPDLMALTVAQKRETEVIYDRTLGYLTSVTQYGLQPYYAMMKKERLMDRFRINGMKIMDYLAANGFPQIKEHFMAAADADPAQKAAILKEAETAQKAALLTALADPNLSVTFVPYRLDQRERLVEAEPIGITPKQDLIINRDIKGNKNFPSLPEDEGAKYVPGLGKHMASFPEVLGADPEMDVIGMQPDPQVREKLAQDPMHQGGKMLALVPSTLQEVFYYSQTEENTPGWEDLFTMRHILPTGSETVFGYTLIRGTRPNGTLSAEGRQNLNSVKSYMRTMRDRTNAVADSHEKESPVLAEHLRGNTDELRTVEDGPVWMELANDHAYSNLRSQTGALASINGTDINADSPRFLREVYRAYENYPAGEPSFRLPQAAEAARRQVLVRAEHERARREGVLTARQDRITRRIVLSELDALERDLRSIDTLAERSKIQGSPEAAYVAMLEDTNAGHRRYVDNNVADSSRYYARGTLSVWADMEGKRAMLASGWPLEDLNLLSRLYVSRQSLRKSLADLENLRSKGEEWERSTRRSAKVLDQIIGELERTPIRNAADRKRMLQMIDGYSSNFYTSDIISVDPNVRTQYRKEFQAAIARKPEALMFLSDEELADAKAAYERYRDRRNGPDPDRPTVNGPRTDAERGFLNTTRITALYTMRGRLAGSRSFARDDLHAQTLAQMDTFLVHVEDFYANTAFLSPGQEAARGAAFEGLVRESAALAEQIGRSIDRLTDNGRKKSFSEAEEKQLDALQTMQDQVRHMRSLHTAYIDHENRRRFDLSRAMQAEQQRLAREQQEAAVRESIMQELREDQTGRFLLEAEDGTLYVKRDYLIDGKLTEEELRILSDAYPGGIPDVLEVQNIDGRLLPQFVADRLREESARREAALLKEQSKREADARKEKEKADRKTKAERAARREARRQEDFTDAAAGLFGAEDQKLREEAIENDPLTQESRRLGREIRRIRRNAGELEAKRQVLDAERRERIEAIASDDRYDEETRRALIESIESEDRYDWEGNLRQLRAQKKEIDEELAQKYYGISRRRRQALDTGDERYTWSFRHILQDALDRGKAAKQAYQTAQDAPESVPEITRKGILAADEQKRYDKMMSIVGAALDPDKLREALRQKWPEWSAQVLEPALTGVSNPVSIRKIIIDKMKKTLPAGDMHEFLRGRLSELREDIREDLRRNLLTLQLETELPEEDQVAHILHQRVEELKRKGLTDDAGHLLDERGVPYPPDVEKGGALTDERGESLPEDSPEVQTYRKRKAYREALEYADRVVTRTDRLVVAGNMSHRSIQERAYNAEKRRNISDGIAGYAEEEMRTVANSLLRRGDTFVSGGVQPGQEEYRDRIIDSTYEFSPAHLGKITGLLNMMEEMQLPIGDDLPGGTGQNRAYSVLVESQEALQQAVESGNEEWILQARADHEKARRDIDRLSAYAQDETNFPRESIPGNIDATRQANVPVDLARDYYTNSKLNAMHNLYSVMKWAGIPIQRLAEDPNAVIRELYRKVTEKTDQEKQTEGKSLGTILGEMTVRDMAGLEIGQVSQRKDLLDRCVEAIIMMDPDPEAQKKNQLTAELDSTYRTGVLSVRAYQSNPTRDRARWEDVQQLLSIVSVERFAQNRTGMLAIRPLDGRGCPMEPVTTESYLAGLGEGFFGYPELMNRAEEILKDAGRVAGAEFDPVQFMENRQKALIKLCTARAADRYKIGFNVLEEEILHMADYYESIRQANPGANLPALTDAQRQRFASRAAQFTVQRETAYQAYYQALSDEDREVEDYRREARQTDEENYRAVYLEKGEPVPTDHRSRLLWELDLRGYLPSAQPAQGGPEIQENIPAGQVPPTQAAQVPPVQAGPVPNALEVVIPPVEAVPGRNVASGAGQGSAAEQPLGEAAARIEQRFLEYYETRHIKDAMSDQGLNREEPDRYYDAVMDANDAENRFRTIFLRVRENFDRDSLSQAMTEAYGPVEGAKLFTRIGGRLPGPYELLRVSGEDRRKLFDLMAGRLTPLEQEELLAADTAYQPIRELDTTSEITLHTGGDARTSFEAQVDHPANRRVSELLDQAGLDWKGMSGGKGTREELDAFRRDLKDADVLLAEVKEEVKDRVVQQMLAEAARGSAKYKLIQKQQNTKPENRFLQDLFAPEKGVSVSKEDRQADIRRAVRTNPRFARSYVHNLAAMLYRMEELNLFATDNKSEEQIKVYAFREIALARSALREAIAADMTVEENRRKLSDAVQRLKTAQEGMDDLMRMAREHFSPADYMDNMDTSRNIAVPWQYSRDLVSTSQVNAVWMFGNLLKQNGISITEFQQDPDHVIQQLKTRALEEAGTLKVLTKGKSMGEIAVLGATNYFDGQMVSAHSRLMGQYSRGMCGIIEADPADTSQNKERNRYLYSQNIMGNASSLDAAARDNAKRLSEGFRGRSQEGFEAIKALTVVAPEDFDPDRMLLKVPVDTDGTRKEPFRLGNYLRDKGDIDYQAQVGRLEKMLSDAAGTHERIRREMEQAETGKYPGVVGGALRVENYQPFPLVQARQQALAEMLALHPEDAADPACAQLEEEVLNAAQRYDALRTARPELQLPELTKAQKKILEEQRKSYLNIKNNRAKLQGKIEDRILKGVRQEEKTFTAAAKTLTGEIKKLGERIGRRDARIARAQEKIRQATERGNERNRLSAVSELETLTREKQTFEQELAGLNQRLTSLRVDRMKTLTRQYHDGKLPYHYVMERLKQIDDGREQEELPALFGDPKRIEEDREARTSFLNDRLSAESGIDLDPRPDAVDHPMNWTVWKHRFWTEEEAAEVSRRSIHEETVPSEERWEDEPEEEYPEEEYPEYDETYNEQYEEKYEEQYEERKEVTNQPPKQEPPKQDQNTAGRRQEPQPQADDRGRNPQPQALGMEAEARQQEKVALLMNYPPKRRAPGVNGPIRHTGSGEILIRSHDMVPDMGDFDPGDETLPREILNTGDPEMLRLYRDLYHDMILGMPDGAMYLEYLDQRITGLERIDQAVNAGRQRMEQGQVVRPPAVTRTADNAILLQGIRQTEFQTASNGCWSVALSNLLGSRGVSLTQKDIRSFRSTQPFTTHVNASDTNEFNNDIGSDPFHDSELVMKTVPNTAMHSWGFESLPPAFVDEHGAIYRDSTDDKAVKAVRQQVEYALLHDRSPVAIKYGGHYQTVIGIKGNMLILKDSLRPPYQSCFDQNGVYHEPDPNRTYQIDLYDVVQKARTQPPGYPRDLSLTWLSELHREPQTGNVEEMKHYPNLALDAGGKLIQNREPDADTFVLEGPADTECWTLAPTEKDGLQPYYRTKIPNEIRKDLLRDVEKPSRAPAEHITIPDAKASAMTGKIVGYEIGRKPGEATPGAGEFLAGDGSFWQKSEDNLALFDLISQVCYDKSGNMTKQVQMVADTAYSVTNEAAGLSFARNLIRAIGDIPEGQRSEAQKLALELAQGRLKVWKSAEQVRDISIEDVYKKAYGTTQPKGPGSAHTRTVQTPGPNTAGRTHENRPGGMQNGNGR